MDDLQIADQRGLGEQAEDPGDNNDLKRFYQAQLEATTAFDGDLKVFTLANKYWPNQILNTKFIFSR